MSLIKRKHHRYTKWNGGKRPASGLTVECVHRDRCRSIALVESKLLHWRAKKGDEVIVRYRIVKEEEFDPLQTNHA